MKIATITGIIVIATTFMGVAYGAWEVVQQTEDNKIQIASNDEKDRKHDLSWQIFRNSLRIQFIEGQILASDNPYFPRKIEDLEKQNRCLELAKQIRGKQPIECME